MVRNSNLMGDDIGTNGSYIESTLFIGSRMELSVNSTKINCTFTNSYIEHYQPESQGNDDIIYLVEYENGYDQSTLSVDSSHFFTDNVGDVFPNNMVVIFISGCSFGSNGKGSETVFIRDYSAILIENCTFIGDGTLSSALTIQNYVWYSHSRIKIRNTTISNFLSVGSVFSIESINDWLTLDYLTVINNRAGIAIIRFEMEDTVILSNSYLFNNTLTTGVDSSSVSTVACSDLRTMVVEDSVMESNSGHYGGALYTSDTQTVSITRSRFTGNKAKRGGAIYLINTTFYTFYATMLEVIGVGNQAESGGFSYIYQNFDTTIQNCTILDNHAIWWGGGFFGFPIHDVDNSSLVKSNTILSGIENNFAYDVNTLAIGYEKGQPIIGESGFTSFDITIYDYYNHRIPFSSKYMTISPQSNNLLFNKVTLFNKENGTVRMEFNFLVDELVPVDSVMLSVQVVMMEHVTTNKVDFNITTCEWLHRNPFSFGYNSS